MSLSSLSFTNITGTVSKTGVILFVVCIEKIQLYQWSCFKYFCSTQIFSGSEDGLGQLGRLLARLERASRHAPRPRPSSAPGARGGHRLDVLQQLGQPVLGALIVLATNKWKLNFCCNFYDNINVSDANLETGGEGVILQLVGETLTQRLAGAGVVRQAQVASHLRKYFWKRMLIRKLWEVCASWVSR